MRYRQQNPEGTKVSGGFNYKSHFIFPFELGLTHHQHRKTTMKSPLVFLPLILAMPVLGQTAKTLRSIVHSPKKIETELPISELQAKASEGSAEAQFALAWRFDKGQGVPRNLPWAVVWYEKAAKQGHKLAQFNLGCCYFQGEGALVVPASKGYFVLGLCAPEKSVEEHRRTFDRVVGSFHPDIP
ncbi:MAG: sel1 repeat family protein [Holophaga sp.]|nr:sel1 repeat family protein [Holophaga sp.]